MSSATGAPAAELRAATTEPLVRLIGVSKSYGAVQAVQPLDLEIRSGDFLAILGPSGCGKTTLLRMIGGFVAPTTGRIEIDGIDVTGQGPEHRPTNMVFQGYGLFPHMNVRQNIGYGLRLARRPKDEIAARVETAVALVRLGELADRPIDQLSGGQQQRVALARALVMRPRVLLLDEPLAALDLKLRQAMQEELRRIHHEIGGTFVFVTHDQGEALGLASRIAVMNSGKLIQEGDAEEIYSRPRTRFVSTFIGEANIFAGERRNGRVALAGGAEFADAGADGPVTVVVRPEALHLGRGLPTNLTIDGTVADIVFLGAFVKYKVTTAGGETVIAHSADPALRKRFNAGDRVTVGWSPADHRVLDS